MSYTDIGLRDKGSPDHLNTKSIWRIVFSSYLEFLSNIRPVDVWFENTRVRQSDMAMSYSTGVTSRFVHAHAYTFFFVSAYMLPCVHTLHPETPVPVHVWRHWKIKGVSASSLRTWQENVCWLVVFFFKRSLHSLRLNACLQMGFDISWRVRVRWRRKRRCKKKSKTDQTCLSRYHADPPQDAPGAVLVSMR